MLVPNVLNKYQYAPVVAVWVAIEEDKMPRKFMRNSSDVIFRCMNLHEHCNFTRSPGLVKWQFSLRFMPQTMMSELLRMSFQSTLSSSTATHTVTMVEYWYLHSKFCTNNTSIHPDATFPLTIEPGRIMALYLFGPLWQFANSLSAC